ncbi:hypothetical protein R1sor_020115 [Riccia sorocarpa]|uniref:TLC domain-containing protein n=1 Tax=Riccia sorocarpa TaxID=122646 RepID=A0ABD3IEI5_9MARC
MVFYPEDGLTKTKGMTFGGPWQSCFDNSDKKSSTKPALKVGECSQLLVEEQAAREEVARCARSPAGRKESVQFHPPAASMPNRIIVPLRRRLNKDGECGTISSMDALEEAIARWRKGEWPDFEAESYTEARDLLMIPLFAVFFFSVRYILDTSLFDSLGRRSIYGKSDLSSPKGVSEAEKDLLRKKLVKFKESAWKMSYFLTATIVSLVVSYNEPYFFDTKMFWRGPGPHIWPDQKAKLKLKLLYGFAGGFYAYSIFALIFWETRRKDFGVSMCHHIATEALIIFSYLARFARPGSVILAIHDASDIFLEIGKLTKYSGYEIIPSISFVMFALSWIILRLMLYPLWIIRSTSIEVLSILDRNYKNGPLLYYTFNTLLISLFVLHIYWWILIWRMIVRQVQDRGKVSDDVRSDDDDDDEEKED